MDKRGIQMKQICGVGMNLGPQVYRKFYFFFPRINLVLTHPAVLLGNLITVMIGRVPPPPLPGVTQKFRGLW